MSKWKEQIPFLDAEILTDRERKRENGTMWDLLERGETVFVFTNSERET